MKFYLIPLLLVLEFALAMKRRALVKPEYGGKGRSREKRQPLKRQKIEIETFEANEESSLDSFPEDILAYIAIQFLHEYPLRSKVKNPLGYLNVLSKQWNRILAEPFFVSRLRSTPNAALHLLQADSFNNVGVGRNWDLFQAAAPILNMPERLSSILSASDLDALRLLADLPSYQLLPIGDRAQSSGRLYESMKIYHPGVSDERSLYYKRRNPFPVMDNMFIFDVPIETIVKFFLLEDLFDPYRYTWIFNAIMVSACHIYVKDRRHLPKLAQWFKNLSGIPFPYTQFDMTCEIMIWPMLLATLLGDWEFLDLLSINNERVMKTDKSRHANYLAMTILKCRKNKCCEIPAKAMGSLEYICSIIGDFDFMGFDSVRIKEEFRKLLPNFRYQKAINIIQSLITRD